MSQYSEDIKGHTVKSSSLPTPATRFPSLETPTVNSIYDPHRGYYPYTKARLHNVPTLPNVYANASILLKLFYTLLSSHQTASGGLIHNSILMALPSFMAASYSVLWMYRHLFN